MQKPINNSVKNKWLNQFNNHRPVIFLNDAAILSELSYHFINNNLIPNGSTSIYEIRIHKSLLFAVRSRGKGPSYLLQIFQNRILNALSIVYEMFIIYIQLQNNKAYINYLSHFPNNYNKARDKKLCPYLAFGSIFAFRLLC